jgi:hypothetical protein
VNTRTDTVWIFGGVMSVSTTLDPSCGECGYCVRDLPTFVCPECGSDLRVVGIVNAGRWLRWERLRNFVIWSLALPIPAVFISFVLYQTVLPCQKIQLVRRIIFCQYPQLNTTLEVIKTGSQYVRGNAFNASTNVPLMLLNIHSNGHVNAMSRLWVDLRTGAWNYDLNGGASVRGTGGLGQQNLLDWLKTQGFNSSDPSVQKGAADILICINQMPLQSGGFTQFSVIGPGVDITAHPAFVFSFNQSFPMEVTGLAVFWVLILAGGIFFIARRSKSRVGSAV